MSAPEEPVQFVPRSRKEDRAISGINYVLIKLASKCNFDCTYCYWFRDGSVRKLPALMSGEVVEAFAQALERHITANRIDSFVCSFHGGEPTLFGAARLRKFMQRTDSVAENTKCEIRYALTTNASLIDAEWVDLIREFDISVTVSIDGPPQIHDKRRLTIQGAPTWRESVAGYLALCRAGIAPTIIAVCDPTSDPTIVLDHFANDLGAMYCDVLMPDLNHSEEITPVGQYYIQLFDHWYDVYSETGFQVRILSEFIRGLLGLQSRSESIGLAPTQTVCLSTSGQLEPHDVLRIAGEEYTRTGCSILTHEIADIERDPLWESVKRSSMNLCDVCNSCRYRIACGGGHIAQRWSKDRHYDNPSVYCQDYLMILDHVADRLKDDINAVTGETRVDPEVIFRSLSRGEPERLFRRR